MLNREEPSSYRLQKASELTAEACRLFREQIRQEHPELSGPQLDRELIRRIYRDEPGIIDLLDRDGIR